MVFDAVILHWVMLVTGEDAELCGFGRAVQWPVELFYVDCGHLVLPRTSWIQAKLNVLDGLFDRVVLQTNVEKKRLGICVSSAALSVSTSRRHIRGG